MIYISDVCSLSIVWWTIRSALVFAYLINGELSGVPSYRYWSFSRPVRPVWSTKFQTSSFSALRFVQYIAVIVVFDYYRIVLGRQYTEHFPDRRRRNPVSSRQLRRSLLRNCAEWYSHQQCFCYGSSLQYGAIGKHPGVKQEVSYCHDKFKSGCWSLCTQSGRLCHQVRQDNLGKRWGKTCLKMHAHRSALDCYRIVTILLARFLE